MTPSPLGPCRKEVLGGITPKRRHSQLKFFEGALRAPLGSPGPKALAPATPSLDGNCFDRYTDCNKITNNLQELAIHGCNTVASNNRCSIKGTKPPSQLIYITLSEIIIVIPFFALSS